MRDLYSKLGIVSAVAPAVLTATTTSAALDLQGFNSALISINAGAIVGAGDFTAKLQESDDGVTFTDVDAKDLLGALPATLVANTAYKQGYKGTKRYLGVVLTKNGGTSIAVSAVLVKGSAASAPVA